MTSVMSNKQRKEREFYQLMRQTEVKQKEKILNSTQKREERLDQVRHETQLKLMAF